VHGGSLFDQRALRWGCFVDIMNFESVYESPPLFIHRDIFYQGGEEERVIIVSLFERLFLAGRTTSGTEGEESEGN